MGKVGQFFGWLQGGQDASRAESPPAGRTSTTTTTSTTTSTATRARDVGPNRDGTSPPADDDRGRGASKPPEIPARGWKDILLRTKDEVKKDRVSLVAAGVAFNAFLALFPALIAFVSIYGLVADPAQVEQQMQTVTDQLPQAGQLIEEQVNQIVQASGAALTTGFVVSLLAALWSASSGMHGLMQALTVAYDEEEDRGFVKRRAIALALTLFGLLIAIIAIAVVVVVPVVLGFLPLGVVGEWLIRILRWPAMGIAVVAALAVIYRYAPNRDKPQWRWVSSGAILATVLWIIASLGFSFYVANFGNYNETYGALGAVIILMLWLLISAFVVLLGAEIDSEMEHQTAVDSTAGEPQPMGQRDAYVADHVGQAQS